MSQYNFEGDFSGLTDRQLEFINTALIEQGLKNDETNIFFEAVGKLGDNYMSTVKRITIDGETGKLSLIVKIASTNEMVRMAMNTFVCFRNEHIMYTEVLPKFTDLEKAADVPLDQRLRYAKCYGSLSEQPNEVIILEDLNMSDFIMLDRFQPLSDACVKSILKNFAILHSLSYALKKEEPQTFDNMKVQLIDTWSLAAAVEESKIYFQQLEDEVISILDNVEHKNIVRHKISETTNLATKVSKVDVGSKHSVIQQGDAWTNNIMFRIEDDSNVESVMIDYQMSKESSPVCDILYMIFFCTDQETRSKHFYEWIDHYHTELDKSLSNFGLKANFVYSKDQLEADMKRCGKFAFCLSVILSSVLMRKSEDTLNVTEVVAQSNGDLSQMTEASKITLLDDETVKRFKNRIVELITGFTEFGLL